MPDRSVRLVLRRAKQRLRIEAALDALIGGSATAALAFVISGSIVRTVAVWMIASAALIVGSWRRWTDARIARRIESRQPALQNLLITAQEALAGRVLHPVISREVFAQAAERLRELKDPLWTRAFVTRVALAFASVAALALLLAQGSLSRAPASAIPAEISPARRGTGGGISLRVTVIPPLYTRRAALTLDNPEQVEALEGSTIRLHVPATTERVHLVEPGREPQQFAVTSDGAVLELVATTSRVFLVQRNRDGVDRLLHLQVRQDARPVVAIARPGRDLLFAGSSGSIPIVVTARDDLNVAALALRYTRIAGSGETFTFQEGEVPLSVSPQGVATTREATGTLVLDQLTLEDGDTLVYRALARDDKPGADPVSSESFLIEIGRRSEASSTGFSLPEDRDRQGLSQQMLIMKTERLHAGRSKLTADAALEQSRLLAVEQRMVRAEFLFMTGGEVVDEVEEAEHAHEVAAGRLENAGQIELLNAIREMSRAEARLNAGDTAQALVFERAALRALERAFDRRRYFLRTLSERARIDPARRFAGDLSSAAPAARPQRQQVTDPRLNDLRNTIAAVSAAIASRSGLDAALSVRVIASDPDSTDLQRLALQLSSNGSLEERAKAAAEAQAHLTTLLRQRLGPAAAGQLRSDPLSGLLPPEVRR